jgi:hypothetical protein
MVVVKEGNINKLPLKIKVKHYQDSDCGMVIESLTYASQAIAPDGKTWFFHDIGGMVNWISSKKFKDEAVMWVWAKDTNRWISHNRAWYSRDDITHLHCWYIAYCTFTNDIHKNSFLILIVSLSHIIYPYFV